MLKCPLRINKISLYFGAFRQILNGSIQIQIKNNLNLTKVKKSILLSFSFLFAVVLVKAQSSDPELDYIKKT